MPDGDFYFMTTEEYVTALNKEPTPEMIIEVKKKDGTLDYKFIPKSILQKEILSIYGGSDQWEMIRDTVGKDGLWGTGILKVKHPVTGEWITKSGMGALRHEKNMKLNYPSLEAQCFKNACKKLGVWFGQTLNLDIDDLEPDAFGMEPNIDADHTISAQWEAIKEQLVAIEFKEDAIEFLKTTSFQHYIPAKTIVNSKPLKLTT